MANSAAAVGVGARRAEAKSIRVVSVSCPTAVHDRDLAKVSGRLSPGLLDRPRRARLDRLKELNARLHAAASRRLAAGAERLQRLDHVRRSLDPRRPLALGFALVSRADGTLVRSAAALAAGEMVNLKFDDGDRNALIEGRTPGKPRAAPKPDAPPQGDLF